MHTCQTHDFCFLVYLKYVFAQSDPVPNSIIKISCLNGCHTDKNFVPQDYLSPYTKFALTLTINSMLNHAALLKTHAPPTQY